MSSTCAVEHFPSSHIINIGKLVENHENTLRRLIEQVYFGKMVECLSQVKSFRSLSEKKKQQELAKAVQSKTANK